MDSPLFNVAVTPEGETIFSFNTPLDLQHVQSVWESIQSLFGKAPPTSLVLDLQAITTIDSSGFALLRLLKRHCEARAIEVRFQGIPTSARYFLRFLEEAPSPKPAPSETPFTAGVAGLGRFVTKQTGEYMDLVRFVGDFFRSTGSALLHFRRFRWRETLYYAQLSGADAMPIVFLLSFLLGLVMAFQAAVQLRQFGANIFVADLLSLALTRELGPVFTAVILAGRSGSAFAAELGTMKVNEEVDALVVMGFDTTKFLVLPKVMALALCGPLLTMLANGSGVFGGIVVGIFSLDLTAVSFVEEVYSILTLTDVMGGLAKSFVFSILIALIGCFRGLQADKGADSVGRQTTSAVVSGIFLIILADAVFTVVYHIFDI